jgi:hypothetical protein
MLRLKQQIPNGRSQERPRREETRSGEEYPQEADELRMRNNLTGDVVGRSWKEEKEGWWPGRERGVLFLNSQAPIGAAPQSLQFLAQMLM